MVAIGEFHRMLSGRISTRPSCASSAAAAQVGPTTTGGAKTSCPSGSQEPLGRMGALSRCGNGTEAGSADEASPARQITTRTKTAFA